MTSFAIIGHLARTDGGFSLSDLPGSGGRMDVLCRCVNASLFLSHDLRRYVDCYLVLCGEPAGPKTVKFSGLLVRSLSPDERSAAALIKKVIDTPCGSEFREAAQGSLSGRAALNGLLPNMRLPCWTRREPMCRRLPACRMRSCSRTT